MKHLRDTIMDIYLGVLLTRTTTEKMGHGDFNQFWRGSSIRTKKKRD